MRGEYVGPPIDVDSELVDYLDRWGGSARVWQLRVAVDYSADFDAALLDLILLGVVLPEVDGPDPEETIVRFAPGWGE